LYRLCNSTLNSTLVPTSGDKHRVASELARNTAGAMTTEGIRIMRTKEALFLVAMAMSAAPALADEVLRREAQHLFGAVEAASPAARSQPLVQLGRMLFWDTRASGDGKTACASCHSVEDYGADSRRVPVDARGKAMPRHSPTVLNAMRQPALRWLADRKSGAELAEGLITGPIGFASKEAAVERLTALGYLPDFQAAFPQDPQPVSAANYARALEAYQATLDTFAPFDRYLAGDDAALTAQQKAGLRTFIATGCAGCHAGPLLGGSTVQKFGVVRDYWTQTGSASVDAGLYAVTKKEEDRYRFRVSMLRNVAKTAPYFHDGSVERLDRAVKVMASVQLGRELDEAATADIVAFLESLTGTQPVHFAPPSH
jgi:cytochrome c peroxidase